MVTSFLQKHKRMEIENRRLYIRLEDELIDNDVQLWYYLLLVESEMPVSQSIFEPVISTSIRCIGAVHTYEIISKLEGNG